MEIQLQPWDSGPGKHFKQGEGQDMGVSGLPQELCWLQSQQVVTGHKLTWVLNVGDGPRGVETPLRPLPCPLLFATTVPPR